MVTLENLRSCRQIIYGMKTLNNIGSMKKVKKKTEVIER